jgi:hypothetical protein
VKNQKKNLKKKKVKKVAIRSVGNRKSTMGRGFSQIWLYIAVKVQKKNFEHSFYVFNLFLVTLLEKLM